MTKDRVDLLHRSTEHMPTMQEEKKVNMLNTDFMSWHQISIRAQLSLVQVTSEGPCSYDHDMKMNNTLR
jgi:hypothetical protein